MAKPVFDALLADLLLHDHTPEYDGRYIRRDIDTVQKLTANNLKLSPTVDSITAFQILKADETTPIFTVDSTNGQVALNQETTPGFVKNDASGVLSGGNSIDIGDDTNLAGGSGLTLTDDTLDLDINSLSVATISAGDFVPFWDITATATNKKITFANFEGAIDHANLANLSTGADHSFIDQDVTSGSSPTFDGTNFTGIDISAGTNLAVSSPIILTDDTISFDFSTNNTWTGTNTHTDSVILKQSHL